MPHRKHESRALKQVVVEAEHPPVVLKAASKEDNVVKVEVRSAQLSDAKKEFFYVILLDNRNKVINNVKLSRGNLTASIV